MRRSGVVQVELGDLGRIVQKSVDLKGPKKREMWAYLATGVGARVRYIKCHLERGHVEPSGKERTVRWSIFCQSGRNLPESRGRTLSDGRGTSPSPVLNELCLWHIRRGNGGDCKVKVFECRVTQAEAKLVAGSDILLVTI